MSSLSSIASWKDKNLISVFREAKVTIGWTRAVVHLLRQLFGPSYGDTLRKSSPEVSEVSLKEKSPDTPKPGQTLPAPSWIY